MNESKERPDHSLVVTNFNFFEPDNLWSWCRSPLLFQSLNFWLNIIGIKFDFFLRLQYKLVGIIIFNVCMELCMVHMSVIKILENINIYCPDLVCTLYTVNTKSTFTLSTWKYIAVRKIRYVTNAQFSCTWEIIVLNCSKAAYLSSSFRFLFSNLPFFISLPAFISFSSFSSFSSLFTFSIRRISFTSFSVISSM